MRVLLQELPDDLGLLHAHGHVHGGHAHAGLGLGLRHEVQADGQDAQDQAGDGGGARSGASGGATAASQAAPAAANAVRPKRRSERRPRRRPRRATRTSRPSRPPPYPGAPRASRAHGAQHTTAVRRSPGPGSGADRSTEGEREGRSARVEKLAKTSGATPEDVASCSQRASGPTRAPGSTENAGPIGRGPRPPREGGRRRAGTRDRFCRAVVYVASKAER